MCAELSYPRSVAPQANRTTPAIGSATKKLPPSSALRCFVPESPYGIQRVRGTFEPVFLAKLLFATVRVELTPMNHCSHSKLVLSKVDGLVFTDEEIASLEVYLHFYSQYNDDSGRFLGSRCTGNEAAVAGQSQCKRLQRRIILHKSDNELELHGFIVPDLSSNSYLFDVRVSACLPGHCVLCPHWQHCSSCHWYGGHDTRLHSIDCLQLCTTGSRYIHWFAPSVLDERRGGATPTTAVCRNSQSI